MTSEEVRKMKRRQYQQKRRQSCNKEAATVATIQSGSAAGVVTSSSAPGVQVSNAAPVAQATPCSTVNGSTTGGGPTASETPGPMNASSEPYLTVSLHFHFVLYKSIFLVRRTWLNRLQ